MARTFKMGILTPKEQKVFNFIKAYKKEHGFTPSYKTMGNEFGWSSYKRVGAYYVNQLIKKGVVNGDVGGARRVLYF